MCADSSEILNSTADTLVVGVALLEWLKDDEIPMCFEETEPPVEED